MEGLQCASCNYCLDGLDAGGICPECAFPVAESTKRARDDAGRRYWLVRLRIGAMVLVVGPAAILPFLPLLTSLRATIPAGIAATLVAASLPAGWWLLSTPPPPGIGIDDNSPRSTRLAAGTLASCIGAAVPLFVLHQYGVLNDGIVILVVTLLFVFGALSALLSWIAGWSSIGDFGAWCGDGPLRVGGRAMVVGLPWLLPLAALFLAHAPYRTWLGSVAAGLCIPPCLVLVRLWWRCGRLLNPGC